MKKKKKKMEKELERLEKEKREGRQGRRLTTGAFSWFLLTGLLFLIAGCTFVFEVTEAAGLPEKGRQLSHAAFVYDGKVRPENEGQLVAVVIDMAKCKNAVDDETGIRLNVPFVRRISEEYKKFRKVSSTTGGKHKKRTSTYYDTWEWTSEGNKVFWGGCPGLEYDIPLESFSGLSTSSTLSYSELDDSASGLKRTEETKAYFETAPQHRIHYECNRELSTATAVGVQRGNRLEAELGIDAMYANINSAEELADKDMADSIVTMIIGWVLLGALPQLIAVFTLRKGLEKMGEA